MKFNILALYVITSSLICSVFATSSIERHSQSTSAHQLEINSPVLIKDKGTKKKKKKDAPQIFVPQTQYENHQNNELSANDLFRRPESILATPGETVGIQNNDLDVIKRLIKAYQRTADTNEQRGNSIWQLFFDQHHLPLHLAFRKGKVDEVANILRNPGSSELFYGFDNLTVSILPQFSSLSSQKSYATICLDHLVRFAEAIGAIPLDNPESYHYIPPYLWDADVMIDIISQILGVPIIFPNPYPSELGLLTSSGIMSYRVPQALYQAHRIKQLLKNIKNPRVLEIGAGLGRTAYYAWHLGIRDYTIVDLPFTAMSSGYFLGTALGEDKVLFSGENALDAENRIKMLTPAEFLAEAKEYDLIINADGFTEMDPSIAQNYWDRIQKCTPLFLSINHECNSYTVRQLVKKSNCSTEVERFPYWMRTGYDEEIIRFE